VATHPVDELEEGTDNVFAASAAAAEQLPAGEVRISAAG
jgi:hypothetical protein